MVRSPDQGAVESDTTAAGQRTAGSEVEAPDALAAFSPSSTLVSDNPVESGGLLHGIPPKTPWQEIIKGATRVKHFTETAWSGLIRLIDHGLWAFRFEAEQLREVLEKEKAARTRAKSEKA